MITLETASLCRCRFSPSRSLFSVTVALSGRVTCFVSMVFSPEELCWLVIGRSEDSPGGIYAAKVTAVQDSSMNVLRESDGMVPVRFLAG